MQVHRGLASYDAPDPMIPSGKTTTATRIFGEAMRMGKIRIMKFVDRVKPIMNRYTISIGFKVPIGFLEIAAVPRFVPVKR